MKRKVNSAEHEVKVGSSSWQIFQIPLSDFGNPNVIDSVVFQSRSSDPYTVLFDQIELLVDFNSVPPTRAPAVTGSPTISFVVPTQTPVTSSPTLQPVDQPSQAPVPLPTAQPSALIDPTRPPTFLPTDKPTKIPTRSPTPSPTAATGVPTTAQPSPVVVVVVRRIVWVNPIIRIAQSNHP